MTSTDAPTLTLTGLPDSCPHCDVTAGEVTEWLLGVHGTMLQVICPRCFTAIAPVRAVAARPGPLPADGEERPLKDRFMSCPCGRGDYGLCQDCPYDFCSVHGSSPATGLKLSEEN